MIQVVYDAYFNPLTTIEVDEDRLMLARETGSLTVLGHTPTQTTYHGVPKLAILFGKSFHIFLKVGILSRNGEETLYLWIPGDVEKVKELAAHIKPAILPCQLTYLEERKVSKAYLESMGFDVPPQECS